MTQFCRIPRTLCRIFVRRRLPRVPKQVHDRGPQSLCNESSDRPRNPREHGASVLSMAGAFGLSLQLLLPGCALEARSDPVIDQLHARFDTTWPESSYMVATVETPQGLWNVYVVSIPPNQVAIRQSRQDGEYEFGMIDDLIWHIAFGKSPPSKLAAQWAWFIRSHEIYRFSEWIATLRFNADSEMNTTEESSCKPRSARDRFDLAVTLCIDSAGDPVWIERSTPPAYGDGNVRIEISRWDEFQGRRMPGKFTQFQGGQRYEWEIQGVLELPEDQDRLTAPENLEIDQSPQP